MRIKKLYSEPEIFDPITFRKGFNLILGEITEGNDKTNGVGKSLVIEFINYGLLKSHNHSRVSLIPEKSVSKDTAICLDFEIGSHEITSVRTIRDHDNPILIIDGRTKNYSSIDDACNHLNLLLHEDNNTPNPPSFRAMLGPLIRDERSEFKSLVQCYDTVRRIPHDYTPHLWLLGIDPKTYREAKELWKNIQDISKAKKRMKTNIRAITEKSISDSRAELNELRNQVTKIQNDIDRLENIEGYNVVKEEIIRIENQLEERRANLGVLLSERDNLETFHGDNYIDSGEVAELYNDFISGLGDFVKKDLDEVITFKKRIDEFQKTIIGARMKSLEKQISELNESIASLSGQYRENISLLDQTGLLKSLKQTITIHRKKMEEYSALSSFLGKYDDYEYEFKDRKRIRDNTIYLLGTLVDNANYTISEVEKTALNIHNYVYGNKKCSFEIKIFKSSEIVKLILRIDSDGSYSIEREKVFIYDYALLNTPETSRRHPGILIHDNIFNVDQDTLVRSLNYISNNMHILNDKQYILTLNSDKLGNEDLAKLDLNLEEYARAILTKSNKFLRVQYQELEE